MPIQSSLQAGYHMRNLKREDFKNGHLQCLENLTKVGPITSEQYQRAFDSMYNKQRTSYGTKDGFEVSEYTTIVVVKKDSGKVVGSGTLLLEQKFIHQAGLLGHIEDIVVVQEERGKNIGQWIVAQLAQLAKHAGAYKITLDCSEDNQGFYEKNEFERKGLQMALYF